MQSRIPSVFFETKGSGDSDRPSQSPISQPALRAAGIGDYNIVRYSSVLPACARRIEMGGSELPLFGSELCAITAVAEGERGQQISAGIIYGWLYDPSSGEKHGGIVCKLGIVGDESKLRVKLQDALKEMHSGSYSQYDLRDIRILTETHTVGKAYGSAVCALCFTEFMTQEEAAEETLPKIIQKAKDIRRKQNEAGCGGTVLPGEYILQKCPDFLQRVSGSVRTIMVGGTNGKTTTTSMIVHMLRAKGYRVFSNHEGANKTEGIATAFGLHCNSEGVPDYDYAVIECDELFLAPMADLLKPRALVLTNLYKDQVERLISPEHTADEIIRAISKLTDCALCLNDDMNFCDRFAGAYHGTKLVSYRLLSEHAVEVDGISYEMNVEMPMRYNLENVAAAASAMYAEGLLTAESFTCYRDYKLPFGRCEGVELPHARLTVVLAKNQIALEQNCAELAGSFSKCILVLCYDYESDFFWLEDLNEETYQNLSRSSEVYIFGEYAGDLERIVRQKCSFDPAPKILSDEETLQLFKTAEQPILAIVGYCGMLRINKLLAGENYTKAFWEE